jgi:CheY-like chemotaxis protein
VYGIIKQHGGDIWVSSEQGKGTTFKIHLPQTVAGTDAAVWNDPARPGVSGNETVLLVEGEPGLRRLVRGVLQHCGYRVIEAQSGRQAVKAEASHKDPIDLRLTDVVLPEMSGREVADALAVHRSGIKVLYLSSDTDHAVIERGALAVAARLLENPFSPETLARKIHEVLDDQSQAA